MTKQPLQSNAYMPNRAHTYYPIQTKRNTNQANPLPLLPRPDKHKEREVDVLKRQNEELRQRQQIYIDKLMKLQQGLQNQHSQFIKLQQLYTELFQSYKQKEAEINQLQMKFRESDRYREQEKQIEHVRSNRDNYRHDSRAKDDYSFQEKEWSSKQEEWQIKEQSWIKKQKEWMHKEKELNQYIEALNKKVSTISESYQRLLQELSSLKAKDRPNNMRAALSDKTLEEFQEWQKQIENQRQNRLKFQYENQFLKSRNADLQVQREQLQKLLTYKQKEISKLREQKIKIHLQFSQNFIHRSPANLIKKKATEPRVQRQTEKENRQVFIQNRLNASVDSNHQYFSFSREKHEYSIDSQLPSFPPQLQIDSLITEHKK